MLGLVLLADCNARAKAQDRDKDDDLSEATTPHRREADTSIEAYSSSDFWAAWTLVSTMFMFKNTGTFDAMSDTRWPTDDTCAIYLVRN
jgi:hypothetical protein